MKKLFMGLIAASMVTLVGCGGPPSYEDLMADDALLAKESARCDALSFEEKRAERKSGNEVCQDVGYAQSSKAIALEEAGGETAGERAIRRAEEGAAEADALRKEYIAKKTQEIMDKHKASQEQQAAPATEG